MRSDGAASNAVFFGHKDMQGAGVTRGASSDKQPVQADGAEVAEGFEWQPHRRFRFF